MLAYEDLRLALESVRIAHQLSGRIRLRLADDAKLPGVRVALPRHADAVIRRTPGVLSVRINLFARSCIVEYDPEVIPDAAWGDLLAGEPSDAAMILERILRDTYQEIANAKL